MQGQKLMQNVGSRTEQTRIEHEEGTCEFSAIFQYTHLSPYHAHPLRTSACIIMAEIFLSGYSVFLLFDWHVREGLKEIEKEVRARVK
jgi:hypothetical protein